MKQMTRFSLYLSIAVLVLAVFGTASRPLSAQRLAQEEDPVVRGARLYDDWMEVLGEQAPAGDHPIWERQTANTRSGPDTWRCVSCHGWDYQGAEGANASGPNFTGFPGVFQTQDWSDEEIADALDAGLDEAHDFVPPLTEADVSAVAAFLQEGLIDDNEFIDPVSRTVIEGDAAAGEERYGEACASCHGEDGTELTFRYEGQDVSLGTVAVQDPWRFLHRTRFGVARAPEMPVGYELGWTPQDGRDVLAFAQGLPTGFEGLGSTPSFEDGQAPGGEPGGPAQNLVTGILTAIGAMVTSLGF
ncbi:MAG TPA: c-type cytochrome, partial [Anaerolineaceae bacterium]|nr:c-type cytochrome [Anaerolineaceae bacterium]